MTELVDDVWRRSPRAAAVAASSFMGIWMAMLWTLAPFSGVDAGRHLAEPGVLEPEGGVVLLEGPQDAEVEDGPEVDVEALGPLAGEHGDVVGQAVHGRARPGES